MKAFYIKKTETKALFKTCDLLYRIVQKNFASSNEKSDSKLCCQLLTLSYI